MGQWLIHVEKWFLDLQGISKGKYSFQHSESCKRKWFTTGYVSFIPLWLIHYGRLFFFCLLFKSPPTSGRTLAALLTRRQFFSHNAQKTSSKRMDGWMLGPTVVRRSGHWLQFQVRPGRFCAEFPHFVMWGVSSGLSPRDSGKKTQLIYKLLQSFPREFTV